MKKVTKILLIFLVIIGLYGCSNEFGKNNNKDEMYIEVAKLTEEEKSIADLLGVNTDKYIFDFILEDTVKSIQIKTYELVNGKWESIIDGSQAFTDSKGRIALGFDKIANGLRVAIQSEHSNGATSYEREIDEEFSSSGYATSILPNKAKINYEEEIPLVIQISTSKNEITTYGVEYFNNPEQYEKLDYENVYAITVIFSQNKVS